MFTRITPLAILVAGALAPLAQASESPFVVQFGRAVEVVKQDIRDHGASPAAFDLLRSEFDQSAKHYDATSPEALGTRARVFARIAELEAMAQQAMFDLLELDVLHDQAIDAALDYYLARLANQVESGQLDPNEFEEIVSTLRRRADAARAWNPEIDAIVGRLMAEIEALFHRAGAGEHVVAEDLEPLKRLATESRASVVAYRLVKRAEQGKTTDADFADVSQVVPRLPCPNVQQLQRAVDAWIAYLIGRMQNGTATRDDFWQMVEIVRLRARTALGGC